MISVWGVLGLCILWVRPAEMDEVQCFPSELLEPCGLVWFSVQRSVLEVQGLMF